MHDRLDQNGGAERMLWTLHEMFPDAPIYTAMWNRKLVTRFESCDVRTSWMQRLPGIERAPRAYAPLYPLAFASMKFTGFDLVISLTTSFAKGVRTNGVTHVCYCNSPSNFVWRSQAYFGGATRQWLSAPLRTWLRTFDRRAAQQPDMWVTNGQAVAKRIRLAYGKDAAIVPPGIHDRWFVNHVSDDFYLAVGRLVAHKRLDLAIRACQQLGVPLVIAGEGRAASKLRRMAGPAVRFTGGVSDDELRSLYAHARAVLIPAEEDFGLVPIEAQAAGTPVIALDAGGVRDTVLHGETGLRFDPQTAEALAAAIRESQAKRWDRRLIQANAMRFSERRFRRQFAELLGDRRQVLEEQQLPIAQGQVAH